MTLLEILNDGLLGWEGTSPEILGPRIQKGVPQAQPRGFLALHRIEVKGKQEGSERSSLSSLSDGE